MFIWRSLWERLEEQKQKKQSDWDEEHKFKNQFRGLNDEEVDFLDKIDDIRADVERQKYLEEQKELEEAWWNYLLAWCGWGS